MKRYRFDVRYDGKKIDLVTVTAKEDDTAFWAAVKKAEKRLTVILSEAPAERRKP